MLLANDQLRRQMSEGGAFAGYSEGEIWVRVRVRVRVRVALTLTLTLTLTLILTNPN